MCVRADRNYQYPYPLFSYYPTVIASYSTPSLGVSHGFILPEGEEEGLSYAKSAVQKITLPFWKTISRAYARFPPEGRKEGLSVRAEWFGSHVQPT